LAVHHVRDSELKKRILRDRNDAAGLKQAAQALHRQLVTVTPGRCLWIGERVEVDSVAAAAKANAAEPLHAVVAALGLWHFGDLPASSDGAVLRVVYRVEQDLALYKPDWRHGFPVFYFACASAHQDAGRTRSLTSGQLQCKEWIAMIDALDPRLHLSEAHCLIPQTHQCHHDLPDLYWQNLAAEIRQGAADAQGGP
jgi:hypothetical protein